MTQELEERKVELTLPKVYFTENKMGLEFDKSISHKELLEVGKTLKRMEGAVQFWIGDWINANWDTYEHGKYDEAEKLGYEKESIRHYKWVAESVKSGIRIPLLSFGHHEIVAPLTPELQQEWLSQAVENSWSVRELRDTIRESEREGPEESDWLRIYDIWNFASRDERFGIEYPGNIPAGIVLNILYYYTEENDLIVDPMAGGGVTIDCCKYLNRRCLAYDINPARDDIKLNNIAKGYPEETKNCDLIFLDPPYYKMKEKDYGENSISALGRNEFIKFFGFIAEESSKVLKKDGYLALLMEPYRDYENNDNSIWVYEYILEFLMKDWKIEMIIDAPEATQRYQPYDVSRAKESKKILKLRRQLIIFRR